jgi:hypothetical protein
MKPVTYNVIKVPLQHTQLLKGDNDEKELCIIINELSVNDFTFSRMYNF